MHLQTCCRRHSNKTPMQELRMLLLRCGWRSKERCRILGFFSVFFVCFRRVVFLWQLRASKFRHTPRLPFLFSTSSAPPRLHGHTFPSIVLSSSPRTHRHESPRGENIDSSVCFRQVSAVHECAELFMCVCVCV